MFIDGNDYFFSYFESYGLRREGFFEESYWRDGFLDVCILRLGNIKFNVFFLYDICLFLFMGVLEGVDCFVVFFKLSCEVVSLYCVDLVFL